MAQSKTRKATLERKSSETQIKVSLNVDGTGKTKIKTPIGLLTHMLELFCFHGFFDVELEVKGDTHIDIHHTNEDIGIALGKAFKKALGENNTGIKRFGYAYAPMEDTVCRCVIDISGRGHFKFNDPKNALNQTTLEEETMKLLGTKNNKDNDYQFSHTEHFLDSFAKNLGATLCFTIQNPSSDLHTNVETVFKSLGLALDQATTIDPRRKGAVPSTKGIID